MHLKMSFGKWRPSCLGLNELSWCVLVSSLVNVPTNPGQSTRVLCCRTDEAFGYDYRKVSHRRNDLSGNFTVIKRVCLKQSMKQFDMKKQSD